MAERARVRGSLPYGRDDRSDMARSGVPFKPYVWRGGETEEPPAVTAARERHRALDAELEAKRERLQAELDARIDELKAELAALEAAHDGT